MTNPVLCIILVLLTDTLAEKLIKYILMKPESKTIKKTKNRLLNIVLLFVVCSILFAVNSFGQSITWQRVLENNYGGINKIQQTTDGGYIAVGDERINNENKIYLVKLDYLGNTTWERIIGLWRKSGKLG